jgi:hypothetical protein
MIESPSSVSTTFTSPTVDNLSIHNRQHHFVTTKNFNVNEKASFRHVQTPLDEQKKSLDRSTPYLSQIRDHENLILKSSLQQCSDQNSAVGSDSGIVMINSNHQQVNSDDNQFVEKKLTDLVQQLGKQLETDAQKLNDKLEMKLKNLEEMIHQQTFIIRRQDDVIERLKSKISKIEGERDHFRERLSYHEHEQHKSSRINSSERVIMRNDRTHVNSQDNDTLHEQKYSNLSTNNTDACKPSTKKV